jgi:hypothetical protein
MCTYFKTTKMKKRSLVTHCQQIQFDFTRFVDSGFRSLMTNYLPLASALDFMLIFLCEGQKSMYRFQYAVLKCHKEYIKTLNASWADKAKLGD